MNKLVSKTIKNEAKEQKDGLLGMWDSGWGEAKRPPTDFSSVTSTNIVNSPQNFLTFSFNYICHGKVAFWLPYQLYRNENIFNMFIQLSFTLFS